MKKKWNAISAILLAMLAYGCCPSIVQAALETEVFVNTLKVETDAQPVIKNGVTYVPFRAIAEAFGCRASYDQINRAVLIESDGIAVEMIIDSVEAVVNGQPVKMNAPAMILNDRTMVSVRFVAETLKSEVVWKPGYEDDWGSMDNAVEIYSEMPVTVKPFDVGIS